MHRLKAKGTKLSGALQRGSDCWIVRFDGEPSLLSEINQVDDEQVDDLELDIDPRQRFTIAHEFAHLLFISAGLRTPSGKKEYWLLEKACNMVAGQLLVPPAYDVSASLTFDDFGESFHRFSVKWGLSEQAAAAEVCRRIGNCKSAVSLRRMDRNNVGVRWSFAAEEEIDWPGNGARLRPGHLMDIFLGFERDAFDRSLISVDDIAFAGFASRSGPTRYVRDILVFMLDSSWDHEGMEVCTLVSQKEPLPFLEQLPLF